jgi:L-ascorbate metabolism protein UlaG (beta-lactamase superfamily)
MMGHVHVNPEEAVEIGRDLQASRLVAMHWGTIVLSTEPPFEPPQRFRAAGRAAGLGDDALWVMAIGETRPLHELASPQAPELERELAQSADAK